jgi:hypothetical protein
VREILVVLCRGKDPKETVLGENDIEVLLVAIILPIVISEEKVRHKFEQSQLSVLQVLKKLRNRVNFYSIYNAIEN